MSYEQTKDRSGQDRMHMDGLWLVCQVTFHLSKDNTFTAEAVDLNSGRHHLWQVRKPSCTLPATAAQQRCRAKHAEDNHEQPKAPSMTDVHIS